MEPVTTRREERPRERRSQSSESSASPAVDREAAVEALAAHAGEIATEERQRALRAFDDEVTPAVHRVLSTLAVRVAVGALKPAATAITEGDAQTAATVSTLFSPEE